MNLLDRSITEGHPLALALTLNAVNQNHLPIDEEKFIVSQQISVQMLRELTHNELQPLVDVLTLLHTANPRVIIICSSNARHDE